MRRRSLCSSLLVAALLVPAAARADVAVPGHRIVPSEIIFTGQADFPAYRFVVAVIPFSASSWSAGSPPLPTPAVALEGKPVSTSTHFFMELRAIPADAPDPVTDAWLASSHATRQPPAAGRALTWPTSDRRCASSRNAACAIASIAGGRCSGSSTGASSAPGGTRGWHEG